MYNTVNYNRYSNDNVLNIYSHGKDKHDQNVQNKQEDIKDKLRMGLAKKMFGENFEGFAKKEEGDDMQSSKRANSQIVRRKSVTSMKVEE